MLRRIQSRALSRGILGGSALWTTAWVLLAGFRVLRRLRSPRPEVLFKQKIYPGEEYSIRGVVPDPAITRRSKRGIGLRR